MKRTSLKRIPLVLSMGLMAVSWAGATMGFPGVAGMWQGFHADEKGYPGPTQNDQQRTPDSNATDSSSTEALDVGSGTGDPGNMTYEGFGGAQRGSYPGHRPNGL